MNRRALAAVAVAATGAGTVLWVLVSSGPVPPGALIVAAIAPPLAVLIAAWSRLYPDGPFPARAVTGGALIGPAVAIAGHAVVAALVYVLLAGLADAANGLVDALRIDPRIADLVGSPWVLVLLVDLVVAAPLTEELGKALGARAFSRPRSRREAFLTGVASGAGFAAIENVLYAGLAAAYGGPWTAVVVARAAGAAVHPLSSGLVMRGWWDAKHGGVPGALGRGYLAGVGLHALWNGSLVVLVVAGSIVAPSQAAAMGAVTQLAWTGALGALFLGGLWREARDVDRASGSAPIPGLPAVAGLIVTAASLLVPAATLLLAFPSFYAA